MFSRYNITRPLATGITHLPFGPVNSLTYGNGLTMSRNYDQDYHLAAQTVGNQQNLAYSVDPNGNLQTANDLLTPANSQNFSYDAVNRLSTATTGPNNFIYSYDAVGNRTVDYLNNNPTQYNYDPASQKLLSQSGNVIAAYSYDSLGQRIAKITSTGTTNFDYDLQGRLLEQNDIPGNYVYLDGEPLARVDYNLNDTTGNVASWNIAYYHNNPVGTPVTTTDPFGNVSWSGQLDPFGNVLPVNANITQNLRFPGQYFDQETGLHYNMQRYYDELSGRYLQADPIGLAGGVNTYTYVRNNPLNRIDPTGLINFLSGGGATGSVGLPGAEASAGTYFNPGWFGQQYDTGSFVSGGVPVGVNVGSDAFIGVVTGDASNVAGTTINQNFTAFNISVTTYQGLDGTFIGGTIGLGPGNPFGYSIAVDYTKTFSNLPSISQPPTTSPYTSKVAGCLAAEAVPLAR